MERVKRDATECIGRLEMRVEAAELIPESEQRWVERAEALANWLLGEWEREQPREAA